MELRKFWVEYQLRRNRVLDWTLNEDRMMFLSKVPDWVRLRILKEELMRKEKQHCVFVQGVPLEMHNAFVEAVLGRTGIKLEVVTRDCIGTIFDCQNSDGRELVMGLNSHVWRHQNLLVRGAAAAMGRRDC